MFNINIPQLNKLRPGKGRLLLSEPFLFDPSFRRSVVLIVERNEEGTVGFILNKPLNIKLKDAIKEFPPHADRLYFGGPVQNNNLFFIHTLGSEIDGSIKILEGLYWSGDFDTIKILIGSKRVDLSQIRFFAGYSGWDADQLDREMNENSWIVTPADISIVMSHDADNMWHNTLKGMGKDYAFLAGLPEDPSLN